MNERTSGLTMANSGTGSSGRASLPLPGASPLAPHNHNSLSGLNLNTVSQQGVPSFGISTGSGILGSGNSSNGVGGPPLGIVGGARGTLGSSYNYTHALSGASGTSFLSTTAPTINTQAGGQTATTSSTHSKPIPTKLFAIGDQDRTPPFCTSR